MLGPFGEIGRQTFDGRGNTEGAATLSGVGRAARFSIGATEVDRRRGDVARQCGREWAGSGILVHHAAPDAHQITELGVIVLGQATGRQSDDEVIVFDATGIAIRDVAATAMA